VYHRKICMHQRWSALRRAVPRLRNTLYQIVIVQLLSGCMNSMRGFHLKTHSLCKLKAALRDFRLWREVDENCALLKATLFTCLDITAATWVVMCRRKMKTSSRIHALAALPTGNISLYQTEMWSGATFRQRVQHCSRRTSIHVLSTRSELPVLLSLWVNE
jgi:hypothetical protein